MVHAGQTAGNVRALNAPLEIDRALIIDRRIRGVVALEELLRVYSPASH